MKKCPICVIATLLAGLGALNWLLLALFSVDIVTTLFGGMTPVSKAVYTLIGVAGLLLLVSIVKPCPCGNKSK